MTPAVIGRFIERLEAAFRDGDPRASWLELDTEAATGTWHRVAYDIAGVQAAMRDAGLPVRLAERLQHGL